MQDGIDIWCLQRNFREAARKRFRSPNTETKIWTGHKCYARRDGEQIPTNTCQDRYSQAKMISGIAQQGCLSISIELHNWEINYYQALNNASVSSGVCGISFAENKSLAWLTNLNGNWNFLSAGATHIYLTI